MGRPLTDVVYPDKVKTCTGCNETLPWSVFTPRKYAADGTVSCVHARCRSCGRRDARERPPDRDNPKLPIGPWREFLTRIEREFESEDELADAVGFSARILFRWRHENKNIRLDNADQALCRLGMPHMLRELWPELYEFG